MIFQQLFNKHFRVVLAAAFLAAAGTATLMAEDVLTISNFTLKAGESKTVAIGLQNTTEFISFQMDLKASEGLTIESGSVQLGERLSSTHTLTAGIVKSGALRLLAYSNQLKSIAGSDGSIVTLTVTADESFTGEGSIQITGVLFTGKNMKEYWLGDVSPTVGLTTATAGDANDDGVVNVLDINLTINKILGNEPESYNPDGMDANGDGTINVLDINTMVNLILNN